MLKLNPSWVYGTMLSCSALLLISGWSIGFAGDAHYLKAESVEIATVQSGEFLQKVSGYGTLQSQNQRLITAMNTAVVDEIKLRPGAVVDADTVLLTLKNPALDVAVRQAITALHNARTGKRKLMLEQQRELLEQESKLTELKADAELATLEAEAQAPLAAKGIIAAVEARRNLLTAKQLNERFRLEQEKLNKLKLVHAEHLLLQDEAIAQFEAEFDASKAQLAQLVVQAGISGVLQRLPVSLGQSVNVGDELALVGSLSPLVAEIKVPQMQVSLLSHGASADIDTRHGIVTGQVVRIDPVVAEGAVQVDILLPENLSDAIRPMQMVDASIYGQSRGQTSFIDRPEGIVADSEAKVFKLDREDQASLVPVRFGKVSGKQIEVISGLSPGDKLILTELKLDQKISRLQLTQ